MPLVKIINLSKKYENLIALSKIDLEIHDGEYLAIVGPSGCGKTTLIKSIAGIVKPTTGDVFINDVNVTSFSIEDRDSGYVFQEIALFPHMSASDNIGYGLMIKGEPPKIRNMQVEEMLHMMNLDEYELFFPNEMSGGAKQKTAIARALASGARLLILDEPLGALDLKIRTVLRYELQKLVKDLGLTAIHVTHDQEEAMSVCDRLVVMKAGKIVEIGIPAELYRNPKSLFTAKFLGEANFIEGVVAEVIGDLYSISTLDTFFKVNSSKKLKTGERCVIAIRPEFIKIGVGNENTIPCIVNQINFTGETYRVNVQIEKGPQILARIFASDGEPQFKVGDRIAICLSKDNLLLYTYPEDGLDKELSLE